MRKKIKIDGVISFLIIAALGYAVYVLLNARSIPFKWRLIGFALFAILSLLCVVLTFKRLPNWATWIRRFISVILILCLGLGSFYISKVAVFTKDITDIKGATDKISVLVLNDSKIKETTDLKGKTVGYQNSTDSDNAEYVMKRIDKDADKIKYVEDESYITLGEKLLNGEIDALIITNAFITTLDDWQEGFRAGTTSIQTYTRSVNNKITSSTGDSLDLNKDCFTMLISGTDETGDPSHNSRCDVVMLVIVNPQTHQLQMVSFPRDSYVQNPALNNGYDKLTHTGNDGVENTMSAIENLMGFDIDFYVKVNFTSVVEIVDALGDIEVDVPIAFCEQDSERNFDNLQCLEKGVQSVNGEEALAFSRHRKTEGVGDIGRTHAQQKVLSGIINKSLTTEGISKMPNILDILPKYIVTSISQTQLENFISYQLENMGSWSISQMTLENGFSANLTTASMGSVPLSCYLLNREDVRKVAALHHMIYNPIAFKKFKFDLNDLTYDSPSVKINEKLIYSDSNYSAYVGNDTPVDEEEDTTPIEKPTVDTPTNTPDNGNTGGSGSTTPDPGTGDSGNTGGDTGGSGNTGEDAGGGNTGGDSTGGNENTTPTPPTN